MGNSILKYIATVGFILIFADFISAGGIRSAGRNIAEAVRGPRQATYSSESARSSDAQSIKLTGVAAVVTLAAIAASGLLAIVGWVLALIHASERTGDEARWFFVNIVFPPAAVFYCLLFSEELKKPLAAFCGSTGFGLMAVIVVVSAR